MELTRQKAIDRVLSFNYRELKEWMKKRLRGEDDYFPLYVGHEPNFSGFLIDVFHHIDNDRFRDDFIEILVTLSGELRKLTGEEIAAAKNYIAELLKLCGNIKQLYKKNHLLEMAASGKLKDIPIDEESDLHVKLLVTLASFKMAGTSKFWLTQLLDASHRSYANPAFYALIDNLDTLFRHIGVFIDRFAGEIELEWGIQALINDHGRKEIDKRFKSIDSKLSPRQKEAVDNALIEIEEAMIFNCRKTPVGNENFRSINIKIRSFGLNIFGKRPVLGHV